MLAEVSFVKHWLATVCPMQEHLSSKFAISNKTYKLESSDDVISARSGSLRKPYAFGLWLFRIFQSRRT